MDSATQYTNLPAEIMQIIFTLAGGSDGFLIQRLVSKHLCSGHDSLKTHLKIKPLPIFTPPDYPPNHLWRYPFDPAARPNPSATQVFLSKFPLLESLEIIDVSSKEMEAAMKPFFSAMQLKGPTSVKFDCLTKSYIIRLWPAPYRAN